MGKRLSEMTLEELWTLFPIVLSRPKDEWADWYQEEVQGLYALLGKEKLHINHIGSTAIHGIWAKPIIDILIEIPLSIEMQQIKKVLLANGYLLMSEESKRVSFNKGYTENGFAEKVFHLHIRYIGDHDELYFRDYMNKHPKLAKQYEQLKLSLWKQYEHDRDGYTEAKKDFVLTYTQAAKKEYGIRR